MTSQVIQRRSKTVAQVAQLQMMTHFLRTQLRDSSLETLLRVTLAFTLLFTGLIGSARSDERPNVLFIAIDDLNDWVGCLGGHPQAKTPNIDRLAARGVLFTNAHCAAPACNPSRAAVFSGQMAWNTGVWSNDSSRLLRQHPKMRVLPRAFSAAGYTTMGTGKLLHSGSSNKVLFDRSFNPEQRWSPFTRDAVRYSEQELPSKGSVNPRHVVKVDGRDPIVLPLNRMPSDRKPQGADGESFDWGPLDVPDSAMGDVQITDWAIEQLNAPSDKPVFLGVGYYRPHIPLWAPKKYFEGFAASEVKLPSTKGDDLLDLSPRARRWATEAITAGRHDTVVQHDQWNAAVAAYLACTTFVDHQVGRLLDALDAARLSNNTLIVLWSDHGWHLGEKEHWGKWTGWERSTRVPLIIVPPQNFAARKTKSVTRCDQPVSLIDLYPTVTEVCGVARLDDLDGQSLVPLLHQPTQSTGRTVVTTFDPGNVSLRTERWRYIRYSDGTEELYDHQTDPNEWTNEVNNSAFASEKERLVSHLPRNAAAVRE
ncbi:MAG: sulfatase [Planctomycetes bacterium]|nr:sulfatase [Planctomycetota bacterium]